MTFVLDETTYNSPNYTPAAQVPATFGQPRTIDGITIHHWGVDGQTIGGISAYLSRQGGNTSAHFSLQEGIVYCLVSPWDAAWHSGSARGNATTIGVECRPEMTNGDFNTLVEFVKWLEDLYGKSLNIYAHQWWSATACPGRYLGKIDELVERVNALHKGTPITTKTLAPAGGSMGWPVEGYTISQSFGNTGTNGRFNSGATGHAGTDWATPVGTPVKAVADGTVLWADWASNLPKTSWEARWYIAGGGFGGIRGDAGIVVVIDHGDYLSVSAHLNRTDLNTGDRVKRGGVIGQSGGTGYVTGPHLHFAIMPKPFKWSNGFYGAVDPVAFIKARLAPTTATTTVKKDWFDMADEKSLENVVERVLAKPRTRLGGIGGTTSISEQIMWSAQDYRAIHGNIDENQKKLEALEKAVASQNAKIDEVSNLLKSLISGGTVSVKATATVDPKQIDEIITSRLNSTRLSTPTGK